MGYAEINLWLKSERNFADGVLLLEQAGASASLIMLLESGENSFTRNKLIVALKEVLEEKQADDVAPALAETRVDKFEHNPKDYEQLSDSKRLWIDVARLPDNLKQLWIKKADLTREQGALHSKLEHLPKKEDRLAVGLRILEIEDERTEIWKQLEEFQRTGKAPEVKQITILDLISQRDALGVRISKHQKKPEYAAKIVEWKKEKEELTKRIQDAAKPLQFIAA